MPITPKLGRPKTTGTTPARSLRVPQVEWSTWARKAKAMQKTVTQWLRDLANAACK